MKISLFRNIKQTTPSYRELEWPELVTYLTVHVPTDRAKLDLPLFSPAEFLGSRAAQYVTNVHAAVIDIDGVTAAEWHALEARVRTAGLAACWYTTYRHTPELYKLRLILQLDRPVSATEWTSLAHVFVAQWHMDPQTTDPSRCYFGPFIPRGAVGHFTGVNDGAPLHVDELLATVLPASQPPTALPPPGSYQIRSTDLSALIRALKSRTDARAQVTIRLLTAIRDGVPYTEEGFRDEALFRYVVAELVRRYPGIDASAFAAFAAPSLGSTGGVSVEQLVQKIEREKASRQAFLEKQQARDDAKKSRALTRTEQRGAILGTDEYYAADLPVMRCQTMLTGQALDLPITAVKVVQYIDDFYIWTPKGYAGPYTRRSFWGYAAELLAPFPDAREDLFDDSGMLAEGFSVEQFVLDHGTRVNKVVQVIGGTESSISGGVLRLPYRPRLHHEAVYSEKVDLWIRLLFGGSATPDADGERRIELGRQWLYYFPDPSVLLPVLLLIGVSQGGKGLFCNELARFYDDRGRWFPMDLLFSTGTENCVEPFMVADEEFPQCRPEQFRSAIAEYSHTLKKKFQNVVDVEGYIRYIINMNDGDRIKALDVGAEAQKATAGRFFYVPVTEECRNFLKFLCAEHEPIDKGELARHITWMREHETYEIDPTAQYTLPLDTLNQAFNESFYRHETRFEVLNVICDFICAKSVAYGLVERYRELPIEVTAEGEVLIRSASFYEFAAASLTQRSKAWIGRILKSLCESIEIGSTRAWRLQTQHLYQWARIAREKSDVEITEALKTPTQQKVDRLVERAVN